MSRDVRKIGKSMDRAKADKWVEDFQKKNPDGIHGWLYGVDILHKLMVYEGSEGIWFFKGLNDEGSEQLVMYAADKEGNFLSLEEDGGGPPPADDSEPCPPVCPC